MIFIEYGKSFISSQSGTYSMNEFERDLDEGKVACVLIMPNAETPTGSVRVSFNNGSDDVPFYTTDVTKVESICTEKGVKTEVKDIPSENVLINGIIPVIVGLIVMVFVFSMFSNMQASSSGNSRMMNFGKSRAKLSTGDDNKVKLDDVAGLKEEKEQLAEIIEFLKDPGKFTAVGARIPKGVLLEGAPGTGKTLLARAVAGEAGVPFFSISGSDFVEMFVGVGASRVRDLFMEAKKNAPCIIFIDEIDAVARRRGTGMGGGHDEREQTLNQMLVEMDGFGVNEGIIVMAATNRVDILDPAILRPGRFDRKITVTRPDIGEREAILKVHANNKPLGSDVDLKQLAQTTAGFTGADLENLLNEAAIDAAIDNRKFITQDDINRAFTQVGIGTEKHSKIISEKEKKITAYHESGHAILLHLLSEVEEVYTISIIPNGSGAGGYTMPLPDNDDMFWTRTRMLQQIMVSMGGRIAEQLIFDDITTGASQDIKNASSVARSMVLKYGFSDKMGFLNYESSEGEEVFIGREIGHQRPYSEDVAAEIDEEVKKIIDYCYGEATRIIKENLSILHKSAELLLEKEKVTGEEFTELFAV